MKIILLFTILLAATGCSTYPYAQKVKMVSFDGNLEAGKSIGNIRGEDCTWKVLGYELGGKPTLDKAFINTKNQANATESAGFGILSKNNKDQLRYITNVTTTNEGFDAYLFGKQCLVATGVGYR